jgi:hypothetical protein
VLPFRERDIRNLIHDLLDQTGAFDGIYLSGLPEERGAAAADSRSISIDPAETTRSEPSDDSGGDLLMTCHVQLTLLARHEDPQLRDEMAELLLNIATDTLGGISLGGQTLPARTRIVSWTWEKPTAPERRITAVFEYQYLVDGPSGFNTAE